MRVVYVDELFAVNLLLDYLLLVLTARLSGVFAPRLRLLLAAALGALLAVLLYFPQLTVMKQALSDLTPREKRILALRFYDGKTQVEVAQEVGISQAQVSRLEKSVLSKIKGQL